MLTLPRAPRKGRGDTRPVQGWWSRWAQSWRIKHPASATRRIFDLHRAFSLWSWAALLIFAWSSISLNLPSVYEPVMRWLTGYVPMTVQTTQTSDVSDLSWPQALHQARQLMNQEAIARGFVVQREVMLRFVPEQGAWLYRTHTGRDVLNRRGSSDLYLDAQTGALRELRLPTGEQIGATATSWLYALHVADVWGWPWRVAVAILGITLAMLSVTGILIWLRKRRA